jgi:FMS-like tyrosine kinase 1
LIAIGKQLGAGCFGRVLKGQAEGIILGEESKTETVAVKMVRSYADLNALAILVFELKILIHLGSHLNIVNLLGACTDFSTGLHISFSLLVINLFNTNLVCLGDFLVIVEYCHVGNLLNHLLANRHCYKDQVDENGELKSLNPFLQNWIRYFILSFII